LPIKHSFDILEDISCHDFVMIIHQSHQKKEGVTMKISKGINQFFNYQKLNVKKKYDTEL